MSKWLIKLRTEAGITQARLADILNVSQSAVACWESGISSPKASMLPKLADALHCSIDALFGRSAN